jgi:hypothetical protein
MYSALRNEKLTGTGIAFFLNLKSFIRISFEFTHGRGQLRTIREGKDIHVTEEKRLKTRIDLSMSVCKNFDGLFSHQEYGSMH